MSERIILRGLKGSDFQHPEDKIALNALEAIPLLNTALEAILKNTSEAMMKFVKAGSCIEINQEQYSSVYNIFLDCCKILDIEKIPKLYLEGKRGISANVDGITDPIVLISEGAVEVLSEDELHFLLGHALGHIKAGHELYHKVAELLLSGWSVFLKAAALPVQEALLHWYRTSILSADRAGLLCCQSVDVSVSVLAKQSGFIRHYDEPFNIDIFKKQAIEFRVSQQMVTNKIREAMHHFSNSSKEPLTILRAALLMEWLDKPDYRHLLDDNKSIEQSVGYKAITESLGYRKCIHCGSDVRVDLMICSNCNQDADK